MREYLEHLNREDDEYRRLILNLRNARNRMVGPVSKEKEVVRI